MSEFFKPKPKRDTPLSVRLPKTTVEKINELAEQTNMSQSEIIEELVRFYEAKIAEKTL